MAPKINFQIDDITQNYQAHLQCLNLMVNRAMTSITAFLYSKHSNCLNHQTHWQYWGTQQCQSLGFLTTHSLQNGSIATLIC